MKILITGAGHLGTQVARVLAGARNDVTLIDADENRVGELAGRLPTRVLLGDACVASVLEHAGAFTADLLVATTGDDAENLVISHLAKHHFAVPRVAARVNDEDNAWLFDHHWGVDTAVPAALPFVSLIEEAAGTTDTVALLRLSRAGVDVVETVITPHSRAANRTLADIPLPESTVVATVIRAGRPTPPSPALRLHPGDELLIVSHAATERDVHAVFQ